MDPLACPPVHSDATVTASPATVVEFIPCGLRARLCANIFVSHVIRSTQRPITGTFAGGVANAWAAPSPESQH